jgi:hypothetical protein
VATEPAEASPVTPFALTLGTALVQPAPAPADAARPDGERMLSGQPRPVESAAADGTGRLGLGLAPECRERAGDRRAPPGQGRADPPIGRAGDLPILERDLERWIESIVRPARPGSPGRPQRLGRVLAEAERVARADRPRPADGGRPERSWESAGISASSNLPTAADAATNAEARGADVPSHIEVGGFVFPAASGDAADARGESTAPVAAADEPPEGAPAAEGSAEPVDGSPRHREAGRSPANRPSEGVPDTPDPERAQHDDRLRIQPYPMPARPRDRLDGPARRPDRHPIGREGEVRIHPSPRPEGDRESGDRSPRPPTVTPIRREGQVRIQPYPLPAERHPAPPESAPGSPEPPRPGPEDRFRIQPHPFPVNGGDARRETEHRSLRHHSESGPDAPPRFGTGEPRLPEHRDRSRREEAIEGRESGDPPRAPAPPIRGPVMAGPPPAPERVSVSHPGDPPAPAGELSRPNGPTAPDAPAAPRTEQITVDLADETGGHGRLRLSLRGSSLRATIIPDEPEFAARLAVGLRELKRSLEDRGFTPRLTVQAPSAAEPSMSAIAAAAREGAAGAPRPENGSAERSRSEEPRRDTPHHAPDHRRSGGRPHDRPTPERRPERTS